MNQNNPCSWYGSIAAFLSIAKTEWLSILQDNYQRRMHNPAGPDAIASWNLSFDILSKELKQLVQINPAIDKFAIIFGFSHEKDRRPDVVILGPCVFVLGFRDSDGPVPADSDRVASIARDLKQHHAGTRQHSVIPMLIPARARDLIRREGDVLVISPDRIVGVFTIEAELEDGALIDPAKWLAAEYAPGSH